ncbi:hypothetical protein EIN_047150 [Entamoeba invadens IP1]|uniref:Phospholipid-transporting ATPase n=1 Tax=Entamoeba invadens IP1 TaxID=370355 RepID=A0A0A1UG55_ENTIV|nr:hypothetical protein EIN_047150 [Entamoeba invadens IP1]ELP94432.1 hypothetical protein EIN_047150 [Entamoeba invadens IP1]|eukprot:XP_004261203.1 hypothetical protein EIN_047150 [Entamoeba invadens IP1]
MEEIELQQNDSILEELSYTRELHVSILAKTKQHTKTNFISTKKYNFFSLFPKIIVEHFYRLTFVYFIFISILCFIPSLERGRETMTSVCAPLVFLIILSLLRDFFEQLKQYKDDVFENSKKAKILTENGTRLVEWQSIKEGNIIEISENEMMPCDCVILDKTNVSFETSQINGETFLKAKKGISFLQGIKEDEMKRVECSIFVNNPTIPFEDFSGKAVLNEQTQQLSIENFVCRGCVMRSSGTILVLATYIGKETKQKLNSNRHDLKWSYIIKMTNFYSIALFFINLLMALVNTFLYKPYANNQPWYIEFQRHNGAVKFFSEVIESNNIIPISLFVTMEIVRVVQTWYINHDGDMATLNDTSIAMNSCLNEELGRVNYILTDKTGTMTQNHMTLKKFSISGKIYGNPDDESDGLSSDMDEHKDATKTEALSSSEGNEITPNIVEFDAKKVIDDYNNNMKRRIVITEFFKTLTICQSVDIRREGEDLNYFSSRSDEVALVAVSKECGFELFEKTAESVSISIFDEQKTYRILKQFPFTPERRRMSVIIYDGNEITMYSKGSEEMMSERVKEMAISRKLIEQNDQFNKEGYRTLLICSKKIDKEYYINWLENGENEDDIERDLILIGVTAVEDKMQEGVRESVLKLKEAGIKVWMVTGDHREISKDIGYSSGILERGLVTSNIVKRTKEELNEQLKKDYEMWKRKKVNINLVMDGESLESAVEEENCKLFTKILGLSRGCVFCRCTPKQKEKLASFVNKSKGSCSLAIGDSLNDVSMINKAKIGIGISTGQDMSAAHTADYSIPAFRFLVKLLLVHGRYFYRQNSVVYFYSLYKNFIVVATSFLYNLFCKSSQIDTIERSCYTSYNILFTSIPIFIFGIADRDIPPYVLYTNPKLYKNREYYSPLNALFWLLDGLVASIGIFFISYVASYTNSVLPNGKVIDLNGFSFTIFVSILLVTNLKIVTIIKRYTWFHFGSLLFTFLVIILYLFIQQAILYTDWMWYNIFVEMLQTPYFYLLVILITFLLTAKDLLWKHFKKSILPDAKHIAEEVGVKEKNKTYNSIKSIKERDMFFNTTWHLPKHQHNDLDYSDSSSSLDEEKPIIN